MANRMSKLTDRAVGAIAANDSDAVYWDGELTGFGVRVRASGRKTWVLQTRVRGRLRWFTLGHYGAPGIENLGAEAARAQARQLLALAKRGIDPREDRDGDPDAYRAPSPSVAELGRRFLEDYVPAHCKPGTQAHYRRMVEKFIVPALGDMPAGDVQRKDAAELHHSMRATPYQANRMLGVLSKMFVQAEIWGWRPDGSNPCRHIRQYKEHKRERFLSPEEMARLGAVLRAAEDEMPAPVAAFRLLLLTGCRKSEIRDLRWEHVTADAIELPDAKTGGRAVPLGPGARAVLESIPRTPGSPWVFPGRFPDTHLVDLQGPWKIIRKRAGLEDVRIHDLRHTFASQALALGESLTMIGRLLGHTQVQTTARYAHLARNSIQSAAARITDSIGDRIGGSPDGGMDGSRDGSMDGPPAQHGSPPGAV